MNKTLTPGRCGAFRAPPPALSKAGAKSATAWKQSQNNSRQRRTGAVLMREIGHFVGGKEIKGASGRSGDVFNPNTGEVQAKVALASKAEVEAAIANAQAAFP